MVRRMLGLTLLLLPLVAACAQGPDAGAPVDKVILIGIESLSVLQIEDMVARGELPHLARMIDEGTTARVHSPDPLLAPMLWSTLLTGQSAQKHQMTSAYVQLQQGVALAPSSMRTVPSLFQILGARHQLVASLGFPGTWPAEIVNGFNLAYGAIPSRATEASEHSYPREAGEREAFPESLYDRVVTHYAPVSEMERADTAPFFVLNEDEFSMLYDHPLGSIYRLENPLRDFGITLQRDRAQVALAEELMGEFPLRLVGVHLELTDALQPVYWRAAWPDHYTIPADARRRFKDTTDACYRQLDAWIGQLTEAAGEGAIICVVGDRGFGHGQDEMADPGSEALIMPSTLNETMLLLRGPGIRRGARLQGVDLVDIAPTLLTALDLAVGTQMDGAILDAAFTEEFLSAHPRVGTEPHSEEFKSAVRYPSQARAQVKAQARAPDQAPDASTEENQ